MNKVISFVVFWSVVIYSVIWGSVKNAFNFILGLIMSLVTLGERVQSFVDSFKAYLDLYRAGFKISRSKDPEKCTSIDLIIYRFWWEGKLMDMPDIDYTGAGHYSTMYNGRGRRLPHQKVDETAEILANQLRANFIEQETRNLDPNASTYYDSDLEARLIRVSNALDESIIMVDSIRDSLNK